MKPRADSENEDQELVVLMERLENDNQEVSGDDEGHVSGQQYCNSPKVREFPCNSYAYVLFQVS